MTEVTIVTLAIMPNGEQYVRQHDDLGMLIEYVKNVQPDSRTISIMNVEFKEGGKDE